MTLVRLALLAVSQLHFFAFARNVAALYGVAAANLFLLFTAAQFHLQFYLSRTLPNFLALPIATIGLAQLLATDIPTTDTKLQTRRLKLGIALLVSAGIIARSEIAVLCGVIIIVDLILSPSPKQYMLTIFPVAINSAILSTGATVAVDTQLWSAPSFPELEALLFNVIGGHASEWGVEPWYYYLLSLPKLLLNPIAPLLIYSTVVITCYTSTSIMDTIRQLRYILIVPMLYVLGFSLLSHKEWRFIVYIIPLLTTAGSISAAYILHHRKNSLSYRLLHIILFLSVLGSLILSFSMGVVSSTNYPGAMALDSLHTITNCSNARVYLDIPTRMTGATLPLCNRDGWTYMKTENKTLLHSAEYWRDIDFAIVGSLADVPCRRGKGVEGKGEWEVIYRQKGYAGLTWQPLGIPDIVWNNTYVNTLTDMYGSKVSSNEHVRMLKGKVEKVWGSFSAVGRKNLNKISSNDHVKSVNKGIKKIWDDSSDAVRRNTYVNKVMSNDQIQRILGKVEGLRETAHKLKVPWIKLEDKVFILKHMRKEDILERNKLIEEKKEKERKGLGKQGEVEGQWRDFY